MIFGKKKKIESLRKQWGKPVDKYRNFDLISLYYRIVSSKQKCEHVDDKTWNDLNFDSIFTKIDRNITSIGQQYLYHKMHTYEKDPEKLKGPTCQIQSPFSLCSGAISYSIPSI